MQTRYLSMSAQDLSQTEAQMHDGESSQNAPAMLVMEGSHTQAARTSRARAGLPRESFDAGYVRRLIDGDPNTEAHFSKYFGELLMIKLRSRLRSRHLIEDLRQETFLRVLTALRLKRSLESPERLGAFVNSVCNHVLLELYRAQSRSLAVPMDAVEPLDEALNAESALLSQERTEAVRGVLRGLSERDRKLLRMIYFENRDKAWVCQHFCVDREYLRVLLHRAKARFRERMTMGPVSGALAEEPPATRQAARFPGAGSQQLPPGPPNHSDSYQGEA